LERDLYWTKDELEGYRRWGEDRSAECRRAWDRCEEIWHEMNRYRQAAGLDLIPKLQPVPAAALDAASERTACTA
jgi:hypothetical protein